MKRALKTIIIELRRIRKSLDKLDDLIEKESENNVENDD